MAGKGCLRVIEKSKDILYTFGPNPFFSGIVLCFGAPFLTIQTRLALKAKKAYTKL